MEKIKKIIVVGGGSSGWMAASYIFKALNFNIDLTVIESPTIPRIGVGEATIPTIKEELFDFLEIPEEEWMPACKGTYKLGIKFVNWKNGPAQGGDHYYHSFGEMPECDNVPLSHIWMHKRAHGFLKGHDYSCYVTPALCDNLRSPRFMNGKKAVHYAYHFDALDIANYLKDWCIARGLNHVRDNVVNVNLKENGDIESLSGESGEVYDADLFVDCTGFQGLLIEKTLGEPLVSFSDSLLTDSAVAMNIPDEPARDGIRPYTTATAFSSGWQWEIPLFGRSGNGYVYSSAFQTAEEAEREMRAFFGKRAENVNARHIKFKSGRRRRSWVNNCVSFGLSSSFLEPLESTGLYFVYAALYQFMEYFPNKTIDPVLREKFNERVAYMVEDVKDFIVMHFVTSPREDTAYWRANKHEAKIPDSLKQILALQKAGIPIRKSYANNEMLYASFEAGFDRFWTNSNYQCVLAGVNYLPDGYLPLLNHRGDIVQKGEQLIRSIQSRSSKMVKALPTQYEYLSSIFEKAYMAEV
ncbi:MAG: tryptophan 7-halogenase [Dinghuibacter sp.]|nr:tryptophan 7-halogenase [Dinghuibacter sp.]